MIANTPQPPYYVVIFSSVRTDVEDGYQEMAQEMEDLARIQPGFLGMEHVRENGLGLTLSYWQSEEAIKSWKENERHMLAQSYGKAKWYRAYKTRVCKVERDYEFFTSL